MFLTYDNITSVKYKPLSVLYILHVFHNVRQMLQTASFSFSLISMSSCSSWFLSSSRINLNLYYSHIIYSQIIFLFLLALSWFLLVAFQNSLGTVVRTWSFFVWTHLHIFLAILNAFLLLWEGWRAMASTIACYRHFLWLLYLLSYEKKPLFSFTLTSCHFTFTTFE